MPLTQRCLFRIIDPGFGKNNIFKFTANETVSLGPIAIATMATRFLPWIDAEVISENNAYKKFGAPLDNEGIIDHLALQRMNPAEIIGISASITNAVPRALEIIKIYLTMPEDIRPKFIIIGGWHAGDDPEPFLQAGADVVVHGEGDLIIVPLIEAWRNGSGLKDISGISYKSESGEIKRNGITDSQYENIDPSPKGFLMVPQNQMDLLPDPDISLVKFAKIEMMPVYRTRGCSGKCKFCRVKGSARCLSPKRLVDQIQNGYSYGIKRFFVVDDRSEEDIDGFTAWLKFLVDWIESYNIKGLNISTQNRLSLAGYKNASEILSLMSRACIKTVCIGLESPIKEELGAMAKPIKQELMLEWMKIWKSYGFAIHAMMIFGYPIQTGKPQPRNEKGQIMTAAERGKIFWNFIKKARPTYLQLLIFTPIIGTEDYEWLEKENRIFHNIPLEFNDGLHVLYQPDGNITPEEIQHEAVKLSRKFYAIVFWRPRQLAIIIHSLLVGGFVISMPFIWPPLLPFKGRQAWSWENKIRKIFVNRWGAQFIINKVIPNLKTFSAYLKQLGHK